MKAALILAIALAAASPGCAKKPENPIDQATVVSSHASVRLKDSSTSRTLSTLEPGAKIEILQQQGNWYRVRLADLQGWMEVSTVLTNTAKAHMQEMVVASQAQPAQNTAVVRDDTNLRVEPGRTTTVIRKLPAGSKVEVIERMTLPRTGANGKSDGRMDSWIKLRTSSSEVGWMLGNLVDFDIPAGIAPYSEDYIYTAVQPINQVEDSVAGTVHWYVVGERRPGLDPNLDFDGIRVFTWNLGKHRYETAFRTRGLRGVYPLEVREDGARHIFRIYELAENGKDKQPKDFVMDGVLVREAGGTPPKRKRK